MIKQKDKVRPAHGIFLMIVAVTFFNLKDGLAKYLSQTYPVIELLFFQYFIRMFYQDNPVQENGVANSIIMDLNVLSKAKDLQGDMLVKEYIKKYYRKASFVLL